jgi:ribonuclease P protein component
VFARSLSTAAAASAASFLTLAGVFPSHRLPVSGFRCYSDTRLSPGGTSEAYVSAQITSAQEDPRVSQPDADSRRAHRTQAAQSERPPPAYRLTAGTLNSEQVKATFREGTRGSGAHAVVVVRPNGLPVRRIGVTVGRRFGSAVRRNRLRRRLREAARELEAELPMGIDIVCVPRSGALRAPFADIVGSLRTALREAGTAPRP